MCTLFRLNLAKQVQGTMSTMMKHAPELVRTSDPVIRSPVHYLWTTVLIKNITDYVTISSRNLPCTSTLQQKLTLYFYSTAETYPVLLLYSRNLPCTSTLQQKLTLYFYSTAETYPVLLQHHLSINKVQQHFAGVLEYC